MYWCRARFTALSGYSISLLYWYKVQILTLQFAWLQGMCTEFTFLTSTKVLSLLALLVQTYKYWHLRSCVWVAWLHLLCCYKNTCLLVQKYKYWHLTALPRFGTRRMPRVCALLSTLPPSTVWDWRCLSVCLSVCMKQAFQMHGDTYLCIYRSSQKNKKKRWTRTTCFYPLRYSVYVLYKYKSTKTDAEGAADLYHFRTRARRYPVSS